MTCRTISQGLPYAKFVLDSTTWVVWTNTQFATIIFLFVCLSFWSFSSRAQVAPVNRFRRPIRHYNARMFFLWFRWYCSPFTGQIQQVFQLSQRDRATHELLRFAKLRSGIFEPPFWGGLSGNVDASCVHRWKKRGRLPIGDNWTL